MEKVQASDAEKRNEMRNIQRRLRRLETRVEELNQGMERVEELLKVLVVNSVLKQTESELNAETRDEDAAVSFTYVRKYPEVVQNQGNIASDSNEKNVNPVILCKVNNINETSMCAGCGQQLSKNRDWELYNENGETVPIRGRVCKKCGIVYCSSNFMKKEESNLRKRFGKGLKIIFIGKSVGNGKEHGIDTAVKGKSVGNGKEHGIYAALAESLLVNKK